MWPDKAGQLGVWDRLHRHCYWFGRDQPVGQFPVNSTSNWTAKTTITVRHFVRCAQMFGAIEAGGTKFFCAIGSKPEDLKITQFSTTSPEATTANAIAFLRENSRGELWAVGIGSFGPVDLDPQSETFGYITSTPK